jgi:hypothetical protein
MNHTWLHPLTLALAAALALTACRSETPPAGISRVGAVIVLEAQVGAASTGVAIATLLKLKAGSPSTIIAAEAHCDVFLSNNQPPGSGTPVRGDPLNIGPTINILDGSKTWATLVRDSNNGNYSATGLTVAPILQGGLSLTLPTSGEFPSFSGSFPSASRYSFSTPSDGKYNTGTTFSWSSNKLSDARVLLFGSNEKAGAASANFLCLVPDSGSFSFTSAMKSALEANGAASGKLLLSAHMRYSNQSQNEAIFTVAAGRAEVTGTPAPAQVAAWLTQAGVFLQR